MKTECIQKRYQFQALGRREIVADFSGGTISSDGGGLLLREVEKRTNILGRFAECFTDHRDQGRIEHTVEDLVSQRVYGIALGYEDLNDHDDLCRDKLLAVLVGKEDPTGKNRELQRDKGKPLAGKSTLNRLELTPEDADSKNRYKKIVMRPDAVDNLFVDLFIESHSKPPAQIILDADATDDPLHGNQEGRFFHGYYKSYCYMPLYIFCGEALLCARLRPANNDASAGTKEELEKIISRIRSAWPEVEIVVRGDSGFCREDIMHWCEENHVEYLFGLARNNRLVIEIASEMDEAKVMYECSQEASRRFKDFRYQTLKSWSRERRVVGKAEYLAKGSNPRFVVTSLQKEQYDASTLYEEMYCARGDMENRIKEQQLMLFAARTSTAKMRANQLRLFFSSMAYILLQTLRRIGLAGTKMAKAQCDTIRLRILKIGARIRITVRKVWVAFAEGCPYCDIFQQVYDNLQRVPIII
ncbi:MAG: IS1380 family transposase [Deltaproteobacteria bacterium]|nr:IS1380 family transposase [Deltaproteobacteria bacterium]